MGIPPKKTKSIETRKQTNKTVDLFSLAKTTRERSLVHRMIPRRMLASIWESFVFHVILR